VIGIRLGQNVLADTNLLDAILADAAPGPAEVVLEVGGGEGVLTRRLADSAGHVHLIEIDERLRPHLEPIAEAGGEGSVTIVWGDAMRADLAALEPAPTAMVANLPYSIATPLLLRTIEELPSLQRWTVMVQREIADRLRAEPGTKAYGSPSVLVQLCCEVRMLRKVDPAVFVPRPRVQSALLGLRRRAEAPGARPRELIRDSFAHRRKAIPRSLELAAARREDIAVRAGESSPEPRPAEIRRLAREALADLGMPDDARAEMLTPDDHLRLAEAIG
jgi:16S rRNA (adenine1518-N6/adenine1519-N6)-dimethyltransferase